MTLVIGSVQLTITRTLTEPDDRVTRRAIRQKRLERQIEEARQEAFREMALSSYGMHSPR